MNRKLILICLSLIAFFMIVLGCIIMSRESLNKSNTPTTYNETVKKETETIHGDDEYFSETFASLIQLEFPNMISYPKMKQFNVSITNYPAIITYCKISADLGSTSASKIYLDKDIQITYYFPNDIDHFIFDSISFEFYDKNAKLIATSKITLYYDETEKQYQISEMEMK